MSKRSRDSESYSRRMSTAGGGSVHERGSTTTERHERHRQTVKDEHGGTIHRATETVSSSPTPLGVGMGAAGAVGAGAGAVGGAASNAVGASVQAPISIVQSHSHEGVLIGSLVLLVMATWAGFWKPTIVDTIWNGKPWSTPTDGKLILGGVVFCIVLAMIADSSNEAAAVIITFLVGLWILFIMMNGADTIKSLFTWFGAGTSSHYTVPTAPTPSGQSSQQKHVQGHPGNQ